MLNFGDTDKRFLLNGSFLQTKTKNIYNVDLANLLGQKIKFESAKEMYFDKKALSRKSVRYEPIIRLPKSPAIIAGSFIEKSFSK